MEGFEGESLESKVARLEEENEDLRQRVASLNDELTVVEQDAYFDHLTGLRRRKLFEEELRYLLESNKPSNMKIEHRERKAGSVVSLVYFDLDYFKKINDDIGHDVGDIVLKKVADTIQECIRGEDLVARWGGEEIVLAMMGANKANAVIKADSIREKISEIKFPNYPDLVVTISAGVSSSDESDNFDDLLKTADEALYKSKHGGRNMVTAYSKTPNV